MFEVGARMRTQEATTLIEIFDSEEAAEKAIRELQAVGFRASQIGFISRDAVCTDDFGSEMTRRIGTNHRFGMPAIAGVAPGIGPAIAGGLVGALFWNAVTISATGAMLSLGVSADEADLCQMEFTTGSTIVVVRPGTRADIAHSVLNCFNARTRPTSTAA